MSQSEDSNIRAKVWLEPDQVEQLRTACYDDQFTGYLQQRDILPVLNDVSIGDSSSAIRFRTKLTPEYHPTSDWKGIVTRSLPSPDDPRYSELRALSEV